MPPEAQDPFLQATAVWLRRTPIADLWVSVLHWTERLHTVIQKSETVLRYATLPKMMTSLKMYFWLQSISSTNFTNPKKSANTFETKINTCTNTLQYLVITRVLLHIIHPMLQLQKNTFM